MIIASRRLPSSSTPTKLYSKLNSLVATSYSAMLSPQSLSTDNTPTTSPPLAPKKTEDWKDVFSKENKLRTIEILNIDRENFGFSFKRYGESCRKAAVLVPLCFDVLGRPGLLMNLRSDTLKNHSGEICFPGGTFDPVDHNDPISAAVRETEEELGILPGNVDIWTICRVFPTLSTKLGVYPIVGFIKSGPVDPEKLVINPDEVDHAFVIPLDHLCEPDNWKEVKPPRKAASPLFTIPVYQNMDKISPGLKGVNLWGLTAFITHLVLSALVPDKYTRKISYVELITEPRDKDKDENSSIAASEISKEPSSKL